MILQLLSSICFLPLPHSSVAFVKSPPKKTEGFESSQQKKGSWNITEVTRHPTYCLCQNRFVFLTLQLQQDVHFLSLLQLLLHSLAKEERHHKSHISVGGFQFYSSYFNKLVSLLGSSVFPTHEKQQVPCSPTTLNAQSQTLSYWKKTKSRYLKKKRMGIFNFMNSPFHKVLITGANTFL